MKKLRWLLPPLFVIAVVAIVGPNRLRSFIQELVETIRWADAVTEGSNPPPVSRRGETATPPPASKSVPPAAPVTPGNTTPIASSRTDRGM